MRGFLSTHSWLIPGSQRVMGKVLTGDQELRYFDQLSFTFLVVYYVIVYS